MPINHVFRLAKTRLGEAMMREASAIRSIDPRYADIDNSDSVIRIALLLRGTPMVYGRGMSAAARDQRRVASVLGIEGTGWDIGQAVRFLLSDQARYITGHTLVVDGGVTLQAPERDSAG